MSASVYQPTLGSNLTDADATVDPGTDEVSEYVLPAATLSANRILTLGTGGSPDLKFVVRIIRADLTNKTYTVKNDAGTTLFIFAASPTAALGASFYYDGTHFAFLSTYDVEPTGAFIALGLAGGQTATGGTGASENLTLSSTSNGTKGKFIFGSTTGLQFNEATNVTTVGIATAASATFLHYKYTGATGANLYIQNPSTGAAAYYGLTLGNTDSLFGGQYFGFWQYGPSFTTAGNRTAGAAEFLLAGGAGSMLFNVGQVSGDFIWATGAGLTERMRLTTGGALTFPSADLSISLTRSGDQTIDKGGSGDLLISADGASQVIRFLSSSGYSLILNSDASLEMPNLGSPGGYVKASSGGGILSSVAGVAIGDITGLTATQLAFGNGSNVGTSSADLAWDDTNKLLKIGNPAVTDPGNESIRVSLDQDNISYVLTGVNPHSGGDDAAVGMRLFANPSANYTGPFWEMTLDTEASAGGRMTFSHKPGTGGETQFFQLGTTAGDDFVFYTNGAGTEKLRLPQTGAPSMVDLGTPGGVVKAAASTGLLSTLVVYTPKTGTGLTDANQTLQPFTDKSSEYVQSTALGASRTKTLGTTTVVTGTLVRIVRADTAAFTMPIVNGGGGAGTLFTFAASPTEKQGATFYYNGTDWVLVGFEYLVS